ncbi:hypothetical protein ABZT43_12325 [Streptomyces sp. NPDC005349]|uniref:hypothetical protein n=1 Tax=Streptomyces sp. NPDC005349 TaxID=3157037 RepID=UPI0033AD8CEB
MSTDLARIAAAQTEAADALVAPLNAKAALHDGPRLLVAVIDQDTNTRIASGFLPYEVDDEPRTHLRLVKR